MYKRDYKLSYFSSDCHLKQKKKQQQIQQTFYGLFNTNVYSINIPQCVICFIIDQHVYILEICVFNQRKHIVVTAYVWYTDLKLNFICLMKSYLYFKTIHFIK